MTRSSTLLRIMSFNYSPADRGQSYDLKQSSLFLETFTLGLIPNS